MVFACSGEHDFLTQLSGLAVVFAPNVEVPFSHSNYDLLYIKVSDSKHPSVYTLSIMMMASSIEVAVT